MKLQRRALQRCEILRNEWKIRLTEWTSEQVMFLDESAANERTLDRKYGWSEIGTIAEVAELLKKSKKWSILPLYTEDGFIAWDIIHGSYTTTTFNEFVSNYVIPLTNPFPGSRSVLCMDNAKIHHNEVI
jgi:hypothetical protein